MGEGVVRAAGGAQDVVQAREHDLEPPVRLVHQPLESGRHAELVLGVHQEEVVGLVEEQKQPTGVPAVQPFPNLTEKRVDLPGTVRVDFTVAAYYARLTEGALDHAPEVGRPVDLVDLEVDPLGHAVVAAEVLFDLPE